MKNAYSFLGRLEGKRLLGRPRRTREDNRMDLREIEWKVADWVHLAQDRNQWRALVNK
jgi:hypothetical protein